MFKKLLFVFLCLSLMGLMATESKAWNFSFGGFGAGCYNATYIIKGGQKPGTIGTFVEGVYEVNEAALVCVNPGNWHNDVRIGGGGTTIVITSTADADPYDGRGVHALPQTFNDRVSEFAGDLYAQGIELCDPAQSLAQLYENCYAAFQAFNDYYGVSPADCRNENWIPAQYLIGSLTITGTLLTDCQDANGDACSSDLENCTCTTAAGTTALCETDEDYRRWNEDGTVIYSCEVPAP